VVADVVRSADLGRFRGVGGFAAALVVAGETRADTRTNLF
jgi:hypothetical protein